VISAALSLTACDPAGAPAPVPASPGSIEASVPGECLRVDGASVTVAAVDRLADDVLELYPEYTRPHARRLALTNAVLPRLALRNHDPAAWTRAGEACAALDPGAPGESPWTEVGDWRQHGLELWSRLRHREPGTWSEPIELAGRWVRARLDERRPHADPQHEELSLSLHVFPYLEVTELRAAIESSIDAAHLEIVDPAWNAIVPESWKYRMKAPTPR
jgi:hypothetical protein